LFCRWVHYVSLFLFLFSSFYGQGTELSIWSTLFFLHLVHIFPPILLRHLISPPLKSFRKHTQSSLLLLGFQLPPFFFVAVSLLLSPLFFSLPFMGRNYNWIFLDHFPSLRDNIPTDSLFYQRVMDLLVLPFPSSINNFFLFESLFPVLQGKACPPPALLSFPEIVRDSSAVRVSLVLSLLVGWKGFSQAQSLSPPS